MRVRDVEMILGICLRGFKNMQDELLRLYTLVVLIYIWIAI